MQKSSLSSFSLALLLSCSLSVSAMDKIGGVRGSGVAATGNFDVQDYHGFAVGGVWTVELVSGAPGHITVECDDNLLSLVECEVERGILHLNTSEDIRPKCDMRVQIPVDEHLDSVDISGVVDLHADQLRCSTLSFEMSGSTDAHIGSIMCDQFELEASGASDLHLGTLECEYLEFEGSGASDFSTSGVADHLNLELSGACGMNAPDLMVGHATLSLSGASDAELHIIETLSVGCSGVSGLNYSGNPELLSVSTSGAASIDRQRTPYPDNLY